jgi:hypothetical protein
MLKVYSRLEIYKVSGRRGGGGDWYTLTRKNEYETLGDEDSDG